MNEIPVNSRDFLYFHFLVIITLTPKHIKLNKYLLPLIVGYASVAVLAGIVVVPLWFNPTTASLHEAFPNAYYAEPVLWAGFSAGFLQTLLQVIVWDK